MAQRCRQHNLNLCVVGPHELRRLLLRLRGPLTPWLRGGNLTQEFGDVLWCHAAGHHLERRWYGDVDEQVLLNRGGLVAGVQLDLLRIQTDLRGQPRSSGPENQLALVAAPGRLDSGSTTLALGKPGGQLNMGEGDASSISVASSWSS